MQFRLSTLLLLAVVLWSSLAVFGSSGIIIFAFFVTVAVGIARSWYGLLAFLSVLVLIARCVLPGISDGRWALRRIVCNNNLKQIALALDNYEKANGCYPPAYIADKKGRPIHSWRVLILPFLDAGSLYKQYNFDESWDGPHNRKLLAARPKVFLCPSDEQACSSDAALTNYVAVVGPDAAWVGEKPRKAADLAPARRTIMLVEVADVGIRWTEPKDLSVTALEPAAAFPTAVTISSQHGNRSGFFYIYRIGTSANVALADGRVLHVEQTSLPPNALGQCLKVGGFNVDSLENVHYSPPIEEPRFNWGNLCALAAWLLSVGLLMFRAARSRKRFAAGRTGQGTAPESGQTPTTEQQ